MVLFKDLSKASSDLLGRDFTHDKPWEVEFKHRVFTINSSVNDGTNLDAVSSVKYTSPVGSLETKMGTGGATTDMQYRTPYALGLTLGFRYDRKNDTNTTSPSKPVLDSSELSAEYMHPNVVTGPHVRFGFNPLFANWNMSATAGMALAPTWSARLGTEVTGGTDWRSFKYSFGGSLSQSTPEVTWTGGVKSLPSNGNAVGKLIGNVHARANAPGAAEYGAEVTHCVQSSRTQVAFAGLWYLDQPLGGGKSNMILKMKMSHDGNIAAALTHKFSDSLTATFGAQVGTSRKNSEPMKCGVKINLTA